MDESSNLSQPDSKSQDSLSCFNEDSNMSFPVSQQDSQDASDFNLKRNTASPLTDICNTNKTQCMEN